MTRDLDIIRQHIAGYDALGRTRALTHEESILLETWVRREREVTRTGRVYVKRGGA